MSEPVVAFPAEQVPLSLLKPHPKNYREHPEDEVEHIRASLREYGVYRNIVVARDHTILAGHGVAEACRLEGLELVPVVRLDLDPDDPRALKVLAGDNGIAHLAMDDDRALTELLRSIRDDGVSLLGTGYDEMMLANLVMITRPADEIRGFDEAAHWVGMPEYDPSHNPKTPQLLVHFESDADRERFAKLIGVELGRRDGRANWVLSTWWPPRERDDTSALKLVSTEARDGAEPVEAAS